MAKVQIISDKYSWEKTLLDNSISDVYTQYNYVKPMAEHVNARPVLVNYSIGGAGFVYSLLISDVADSLKFSGIIPHGTYYDSETPYGYGGPIFYGNINSNADMEDSIHTDLYNSFQEENIISQFIRFNPLHFDPKLSPIIVDKYGTYKNTIYIDLFNEDTIMNNLDTQYRRKIRKAREAGIEIIYDKGEHISEFISLYNMTMKLHDSEDMYYFKNDYYDSLIKNFYNNIIIFYALLNNRIIASSIFLYDKDYMHFHLGGRNTDAPKIPFDNLLMVEAAMWGHRNGLKKLHIGGGLAKEDSLFQYKKKFNRSGILPFYIGRSIYDSRKYNELMNIRADTDPDFDPYNSFYIQYRF